MSMPPTKKILGLMITDPSFRERFEEDPRAACEEWKVEIAESDLQMLISGRLTESKNKPLGEVLDDRIKRRPDDIY